MAHNSWLTVPEISVELRIARSKAYDLVASGSIPAVRIGRSLRVRRRDLERWLEEHRHSN